MNVDDSHQTGSSAKTLWMDSITEPTCAHGLLLIANSLPEPPPQIINGSSLKVKSSTDAEGEDYNFSFLGCIMKLQFYKMTLVLRKFVTDQKKKKSRIGLK